MKQIKALLLTLLFSSSLFAGEWVGDFDIKHLVLEGEENQPWANISLMPNPQTSCTDNTFVTLQTNNERGIQSLSVFMMAASTNKKVKVYLDGCLGARPHVKHIWVIN